MGVGKAMRADRIYAEFGPVADDGSEVLPLLSPIWSLWNEARRVTGGRPTRAAIDPLALPASAWRHCFLLDAGTDGFRVRLFGTFMVELAGCDPTGRILFAHGPDAEGRGDGRVFTQVLQERRPYRCLHTLAGFNGNRGVPIMETVLLPLFDDSGAVTMIFGGGALPPAKALIDPVLQKEQANRLFNRNRSARDAEEGRHCIAV